MTRGGRAKQRDEPERRCLATGETGPKAGLLRFVLDPDGVVAPDLAEKLPGRGVWLSADRAALATAAKKNLFARGFKRAVPPFPDLVERVEALLVRRVVEALALARKAGVAVAGFEKCREAAHLAVGLFQAHDGASGGKAKMRRFAPDVPELDCLFSHELGLAFGRVSVIHAVLTSGGASTRAIQEARRLDGVRFGRDAAPRVSSSPRAEQDPTGVGSEATGSDAPDGAGN
ncbi:MAG: RNA-binding protein [Pseudomonadota bacterium]